MVNYGYEFETKRYLRTDEDRELPISIEEWRKAASEKLPNDAWWYIEGSAGNNSTFEHNEYRMNSYRIRPRYLRNVENSSIETSILGRKYKSPFIIAPLGAMSIVGKDADLAGAKAAEALGLIYCLSTVASSSIEEIAVNAPNLEKWFQLYPGKDLEIMKSFVRRAEKSRYRAIIVTVDTTMLGWREKDLQNAYLPFMQGHGIRNYITDEHFRKRLKKNPKEDMMEAVKEWLSIYVNPSFDWNYFDKIRSWTKLPLFIKGITSPLDVKLAFEHKADGVIVSNHGGRQVDGAISTIDALNEITMSESYKGRLIIDSGIRGAADVMRAFSLGATGVMIGRPYAYALATAGREGVQRLFTTLMGELSLQLALSGFNSLDELNRECILIQ